jgi:hypothetical protein
MKILRIAHVRVALAGLVGAYGLSSLVPVAANALYKLGAISDPGAEAAQRVALWAATPWWQLGFSAAMAALFLTVAWRLVRGRPALGLYVAALFGNAVVWWVMHSAAAYQQVFAPAEVQMDYDIMLGMAVAGAAIWWLERRGTGAPASA